MRDPDHASLLLRLAADELRALAAMENPALFSDAIFGFHAHQELVELNPFAVQFRYDAFDEQGESLERPGFLLLLQGLFMDARSTLDVQGRE